MIGKTISHYTILEKLGEGGMGVIYKAEDTKLKRIVALKFLPAEMTRDPEAKTRFIQEAQAASSLDHTNICTIHEIGEKDDEQMFIAMACYEGETLESKIRRGPVDVDEAIRIAVQVGEGLAKAHARGIVHRDIKPANIMVTHDGVAKILDFGLAKLVGRPTLTKTGSTVGTVAYMSPEQVQGGEVDHRTDIWSLGVVLYEMLAGTLPFKGEHEAALLYSIVHEEAQPLSLLRPGTPASISSVIARMLQKNTASRYQTATELVTELKRVAAAFTGMPAEEKSILVLPFENLSPEPDQEYFSDGLTEEVISDLSNVRALRVISRSSAMTFKGTKKKVPEIARELGVQYVLEGSVRKAGNSLRITAQLIDAKSDVHVWAEKFSGTIEDVFDVQERVSRSIVDALKLKLSAEESRRIAERPIDNVAAYQCYLKALVESQRFKKSSLDRARDYLEKALEILGDNVLLYSALAHVYWQYANMGVGQEECIQKVQEYARKALALDPNSPEALVAMGLYKGGFGALSWDVLRDLKAVLAVDPNHLAALRRYSSILTISIGRPDAANPLVERARRIDPLHLLGYWHQARPLFFSGQYGQALELIRKNYQVDPENPLIRFFLAWALAYLNESEEALSIIDRSAEVAPGNVFTKFSLLLKYGLLRDKEKALQEITPAFRKTCRRDNQWSYFVAVMLALNDAREESLDWLENAVNLGFINYPELERNPYLENLRGEERFKSLMERAKYEWENFEV